MNTTEIMKQLVIAPKGSISPKDKEKMSKEGYLLIEAEDVSAVKIMVPTSESLLTGDILLEACLETIKQYNNGSLPSTFTGQLLKRLIK